MINITAAHTPRMESRAVRAILADTLPSHETTKLMRCLDLVEALQRAYLAGHRQGEREARQAYREPDPAIGVTPAAGHCAERSRVEGGE